MERLGDRIAPAFSAPNVADHFYGSLDDPRGLNANVGQCTWYVYGRIQETGRITAPELSSLSSLGIFAGDANTWYSEAGSADAFAAGIRRGTASEPGAIACWNPGSGFDHVAFVEDTSGHVTESNLMPGTISAPYQVVTDGYVGNAYVKLHSDHSTSSNTVWQIPQFTVMNVTGPPVPAEDYQWFPLTANDGNPNHTGWAALLDARTGLAATSYPTWNFTGIQLSPGARWISSPPPSGYIYLPSQDAAPTAALSTVNNPALGQPSLQLPVEYEANNAIRVSTIGNNDGNNDLWVTGPNGFNAPAIYPSVEPSGNGSPRFATYTLMAPGGAWDPSDNGTYQVWMLSDAVKDTSNNSVAAGLIGSYIINVSSDHSPPTVNAFDVQPRAIAFGSAVTISWTVADSGNSGMKRVELWRAPDVGGTPGTWEQVGAPESVSGNGPSSGAFTHSPPSAGGWWYGVHVVDNAGNWGHEDAPVKVTVAAAAGPVIDVELPSQENVHSYDFASVETGYTASRVFTVRNEGMQPLNISQVSLLSAVFTIDLRDTSGNTQDWTSIPAGSTRTFTLMFSPTDPGSFNENLVLTSNAGTYRIALSGIGVAPATPGIAVAWLNGSTPFNIFNGEGDAPGSWFSTVSQNAAPPTQTYVVRNNGTGVLVLSLSLPTGFTVIEPLDPYIPEGGSDTFTVGMLTGTLGTLGGNLAITNNAWRYANQNNGLEGPFVFGIGGKIDILPPVVTEISGGLLQAASQSAYGASCQYVTSDPIPLIWGTAIPGSTITVSAANNWPAGGTTTVDANGHWTLDERSIVTSADWYRLLLTQTDPAGNTSLVLYLEIVVDTNAPAPPAIAGITTNTGALPSGGLTNDPTDSLYGTAESGSAVTLFDNGTAIGMTTADPAGVWTFDDTATTLPDGEHQFTATATDVVGNRGPESAAFTSVVDTNAPTVIIVGGTLRPTINFSEPVTGLAIGDFQLKRNGRKVSLAGLTVIGSGDSYVLDLSSKTVKRGTYVLSVTMTGTPILDAAGNGSGASAIDRFAIKNPPRLIGPVSKVADLRPTLWWSAVTNTTAYEVQLNDVSANRRGIFSQILVADTWWALPSDLISGRTYSWRVRAINSAGSGPWSMVSRFSISRPAPSGPTGDISNLSPTFSWSTVTGATIYRVKLDDLTTRKSSSYLVTDPTWTPPADLIVGHRYRFAVEALNSLNEGKLGLPLILRIV
jgi:surface antigen